MSLPTTLTLTNHAIDRYCERWRPTWRREDAEMELRLQARRAVFRERDDDGGLIYVTPRGALLVVALDGAVRTVLPPGSTKPMRRPQSPRNRRRR